MNLWSYHCERIRSSREDHARPTATKGVYFQMTAFATLAILMSIHGAAANTTHAYLRPTNDLTNDTAAVVSLIQPKMIKIFGTGGRRRLEAYQTGFFVSSDGFIVTAWSYVLDGDPIVVTLHDGSRHDAKLVGFHPQMQIALLQIEGSGFPFFNLESLAEVERGTRVLAFSNLYGVASDSEPVSVQRGLVATEWNVLPETKFFDTNFQGSVWLLDAITSNPGSAGGAITDRHGRLVGMIGKELADPNTGLWSNYAWKASDLSPAIDAVRSGQSSHLANAARLPTEPLTLKILGLQLVPPVVTRTPPYVDLIARDSPADRAGLQRDDLLIEIDGRLITSVESAKQRLQQIDRDATIMVTVQRGRTLMTLTIQP